MNNDFNQLLSQLFQELSMTPLSPIIKHAQSKWDTIFQKAITFYNDETLFDQFYINEIEGSSYTSTFSYLTSYFNEDGYALSYEWDCLLFGSDQLPVSLLQALIDYEQLSMEEETFVTQIRSSKLSIFEMKDIHFDEGYVILEDIFTHTQHRVYDSLLLLDASMQHDSHYLFTRILPVQNEWILAGFEELIDKTMIEPLKKRYSHFTMQCKDECIYLLKNSI